MATKHLSPEMMKFLVANSLKKDKFVVQSAGGTPDGAGISFKAMSESGFITVTGVLADPQADLPLEDDENEDDVGDDKEPN